jgi:hypothetical protein
MMFFVYLILLSTCFLYFFFHVKGKRVLKVVGVVLFLHGYLTIHSTVAELSGYPTTESIPESVQVLWGNAVEPNPSEEFPGYIDLWVVHNPTQEEDWFSLMSLADEGKVSRIYRIPYTKKDHKALKEMVDRIKRGKRVGLALEKKGKSILDLSEAQQRYNIRYNSIMIKK